MSDIIKKLSVMYEGSKIYDIAYSQDFEGLTEFYKEYNPDCTKKLCIVSDSKVASLYMDAILRISEGSFSKVVSYVFPEGEESKNLDTVKSLYVKLIEEHFDRRDVLLALGGGVTGDMCGYAAATYLRGIDFIQVPTSLLADVDSSIGGKTGVDFDQYKNMVGAFHMPKLVYINLSTLNSLDKRQFFSGMGEVVKSALIKDAEFYEWLKTSNVSTDISTDMLQHMVYSCNVIKKHVVEDDPHETKGERALLNFGHTLGHALEKYMNFTLLHGECVSIGCIMAAIISRDKGLISQSDVDDIAGYITSYYDLPHIDFSSIGRDYESDEKSIGEIVSYTHNDKKAVGKAIKFILLESIGHAIIRTDVSDEAMTSAFTEYMNKYNK